MKRSAALIALVSVVLGGCDESPTSALSPSGPRKAVTAPSVPGVLTVIGTHGSLGGLNNFGQIAGFTRPTRKAFFWWEGELTMLPEDHGYSRSVAWSINDANQIVGYLGSETEAFIWDSANGYTLLGPGGVESINNAAAPMAAGNSAGAPAVWAFDGSGWQRTLLPAHPESEWGSPFDLNDAGDAAGAEWVGGQYVPVAWMREGTGWVRVQVDYLPGYTKGLANGINNAGQVSGAVGVNGFFERAFLWENGTVYDLPPIPGDTYSFAYMLNDFGDVAGGSGTDAVIWRNRIPLVLPRPQGAVHCVAVRINETGDAGGDCGDTFNANARYPVIWHLGEFAVEATATQLEEFIASGDIASGGTANSLQSKLRSAQAALDEGNTMAAAKMYGAFANHVEALSGKNISEPAAQTLSASATMASDYLAQ